jgi:mono/diheme cytochrome c family protein
VTLPVLFSMLSNHFPSTYGSKEPWLVLAMLFVFGVGLKYGMNKRTSTPPAAVGGTVVALAAVVFLTRPPPDAALLAYEGKPKVAFATVSAIVQARCTNCHAVKPSSPMFAAPPQGVMLDTPDGIKTHADRMFVRAVSTKTMPLGNLTGMTQEERDFLGAWFAQGADTKAEGASQLATAPVPLNIAAQPTTYPDGGADKIRAYFVQVCLPCHGPEGKGNGPASTDLNPKPRNFHDPEWQKSVTDDHIRTTILKGGEAVGKSPVMPENPALEEDKETLEGLVKFVRAFGGKP